MPIDEAIEHALEVSVKHRCDDAKCAEDHRQLAYWLIELKDARHYIAYLRVVSTTYRRCIYLLATSNFITACILCYKLFKAKYNI